jgi:hypothetical protein
MKAPRRLTPKFDPLDLALITGSALPRAFSKWRAARRVEFPREPGLLWGMPSLAAVFEIYHGRAMTDDEAADIAARAKEVTDKLAMMEAARRANG